MKFKGMMLSLCLLLPLSGLAAVDCNTMNVAFNSVYAKLMPHNFTDLAVYFTAVNHDAVPHTLSTVGGDDAASGEFMTYYGPQGPKQLQPMTNLVIPAKGKLFFKPGNNHVRLLGYKVLPKPGSKIDIKFTFDDGCTKDLNNVPVKDRMN